MSQNINDIIHRPFGDGKDGNLTISSNTVFSVTNIGCSGSIGSYSLTLASSGFSNGDLIIIHQSRGTGVGQWEVNYVISGGGTTTLTLLRPLTYTYIDSGASQAQVQKLPRYENVVLNARLVSTPWNGNTGGILCFAAKKLTNNDAIYNVGQDGQFLQGYGGGGDPASPPTLGGGYYGGDGKQTLNGYNGEGTLGASFQITANGQTNGNGGGSAYMGDPDSNKCAGTGGGGGNGAVGNNGVNIALTWEGEKGGQAGNAALTNMVFGGGGGAAVGSKDSAYVGGGGQGGGILALYVRDFINNGYIYTSGGHGGEYYDESRYRSGGGGAGGSMLFKSNTWVNNGTIESLGGNNTIGSKGGDGAVGRIHLDYLSSYSGVTTPTINVTQDRTLNETFGGAIMGIL